MPPVYFSHTHVPPIGAPGGGHSGMEVMDRIEDVIITPPPPTDDGDDGDG